MFKLVIIVLAFIWLNEAAITSLQLVVPDDPYSVLTAGKSSTTTLGHPIPTLSNAISDEDKSNNNLSEESNESTNISAATAISSSSPAPTAVSASAPADITRAKTTSLPLSPTLSSITSSSTGLSSRGTLLISSSAHASASTGSSSSLLSSSSPVASARSSATIQHRVLPAESIPLPITISTRPGLRTVIAPETLTIQQPAIAKVGEVVQQIPTAVSHQRQTVVHNHARVVTPIVAPAVRTLTSQIVRAYHTPLVYAPHVVEN